MLELGPPKLIIANGSVAKHRYESIERVTPGIIDHTSSSSDIDAAVVVGGYGRVLRDIHQVVGSERETLSLHCTIIRSAFASHHVPQVQSRLSVESCFLG